MIGREAGSSHQAENPGFAGAQVPERARADPAEGVDFEPEDPRSAWIRVKRWATL
jgi:hypothetical protein